jgi:hypothetical protein
MQSKAYYRMSLGTHNSLCQNFSQSHWVPCDAAISTPTDSTEIFTYVEGSEGTHLSLGDNPAVHAVSLLILGTPLCSECVAALSSYGITAQDTAWTCGKKLGAVHPGLKPSRF